MNEKKYNKQISQRIHKLCDFIIDGLPTYDLCCDHGLIGYTAYETRNIPEVTFVDQIEHITDDLRNKINTYASNHPFKIITAPAERIELTNQPVNVIIAGVHAQSIYNIIKHIPLNRMGDNYIFSPNSDHDYFEKTIENFNLTIDKKETIYENGRHYPIFKCKVDSLKEFKQI